MTKTIKRFAAAWRMSRRSVVATREVEWTTADADTLAGFLRTETGRRLIATLRNLTFADVHAAVSAAPQMLTWRCGHAAGMQCMAGQIDMLATYRQQDAAKTTGPTDDLTWLHGNTDSR